MSRDVTHGIVRTMHQDQWEKEEIQPAMPPVCARSCRLFGNGWNACSLRWMRWCGYGRRIPLGTFTEETWKMMKCIEVDWSGLKCPFLKACGSSYLIPAFAFSDFSKCPILSVYRSLHIFLSILSISFCISKLQSRRSPTWHRCHRPGLLQVRTVLQNYY